MKERKGISFIIIILISLNFIYSENIYFFAKTSFKNAQFWEKQYNKYQHEDTWNIFANYFIGAIGGGVDWVIWDSGKKVGSRIYLKSSLNLDLAALSFIGGYKDGYSKIYDYALNTMYDIRKKDKNGESGALYLGVVFDLFMGGSFPKTDLLWGVGCGFNFYFPAYTRVISVNELEEKFGFFTTPSILLAYDFFIPDTKLKITPQLVTGFTCLPLIQNELIEIKTYHPAKYYTLTPYSGIFTELSINFSFYSIQWKR